MVDKVFADWQGNPENEFPHLDTKRKIAPFGSKQFNKFTLTNIPPAKTLDFESNLCYCYDCDLKQDFEKVKLPKRQRPKHIRKETKGMGRGRDDIEYSRRVICRKGDVLSLKKCSVMSAFAPTLWKLF